MNFETTNPGALAHLTVLDLSNFLAGPSVSMYLGDFGAEVIKVERPDTGDEFRNWGHEKNGVGLYFKVVNRNKKSVTADLRTALGVEVVKRLVQKADVVIENYRPGTMEKWGLGYDVLSAIKPDLVMLRLSGYGQTGPDSGKPAFGTALEGFAGAVYISGFPDRPPMLPAFGLADASAGLMGAFLVLSALEGRKHNGGKGQVIDLALYETALTMLGPLVVDHDQLGIVQERMGSRVPWVAPRNVYGCRDGNWVSVSASSQATFKRLCEALDVPDLVDDPRFADNRARIANVDALDTALQNAIARFDRDALISRIEEHNGVVGTVQSVAEIVAHPHIVARENIVAVQDAELGSVLRMQNVVGKMSATPGSVRHAGPALGQHNREILMDRLGFSAQQLAQAGITIKENSSC